MINLGPKCRWSPGVFGYPDFSLASADRLVDDQYADRRQLRPIFDLADPFRIRSA